MDKYALVYGERVYQIVESNDMPDWPATQEGVKPEFVLIPEGVTVETGFGYKYDANEFIPYERYSYEDVEILPVSTPEAADILLARSFGIQLEITPEILCTALFNAPVAKLSEGGEWQPGVKVSAGSEISFKGKKYRVVQEHITMAEWEPDAVAALYAEIREEGSQWVQPLGGHDAYNIGDIVTFEGHKWKSEIDNNIWRPGEYGWVQITDESI